MARECNEDAVNQEHALQPNNIKPIQLFFVILFHQEQLF